MGGRWRDGKKKLPRNRRKCRYPMRIVLAAARGGGERDERGAHGGGLYTHGIKYGAGPCQSKRSASSRLGADCPQEQGTGGQEQEQGTGGRSRSRAPCNQAQEPLYTRAAAFLCAPASAPRRRARKSRPSGRRPRKRLCVTSLRVTRLVTKLVVTVQCGLMSM